MSVWYLLLCSEEGRGEGDESRVEPSKKSKAARRGRERKKRKALEDDAAKCYKLTRLFRGLPYSKLINLLIWT